MRVHILLLARPVCRKTKCVYTHCLLRGILVRKQSSVKELLTVRLESVSYRFLGQLLSAGPGGSFIGTSH